MKHIKSLAAAVCCIAPLGTANAAEFYFGGDLMATRLSAGQSSTATLGTIGARAGALVHPNFAIEGRFGFGVADDGITLPTPFQMDPSAKLDLDHYAGIYGKAILPVGPAFDVYGLLGYTRAKATFNTSVATFSNTEEGFSYGIGGQFAIGPSLSVFGEWTRLVDTRSFELDGASVGFSFKFGR